tara:strand:+ start:1706 stop:2392 length:687 start_codon:yes stop_codon:yes gene_type:complete
MEIIPVLDIYKNKVVTAIQGKRHEYKPINTKLYNSTDPLDIINSIKEKFKPEIIYIADLDAIIDNKASHKLLNSIIEKNPSIIFWVDSGLKIINLKRRYVNYNPIFCSEKSTGFDIKNIPSNKFVCSLDYNKKIMGNTILPKLHRYLPKKIILMDLSQVGSNEFLNFKILKKYSRYQKKYDLYVAGGIKNTLDIQRAKKLGVKGALVSSILYKQKLPKLFITKEKTSL